MDIPFINEFLKVKRKEAGLTQDKFADLIFKSKPTVARYDSGDTIPESVLWTSCNVLKLDFLRLLNTQRMVYDENYGEEYVRLASAPYCNLIKKFDKTELASSGVYSTIFSFENTDNKNNSSNYYNIETLKNELNKYLDLKNDILNIPVENRNNEQKIQKIFTFIDFLYFDDIIKK